MKINGKGLIRIARSRSIMQTGVLVAVLAFAAPPAYAGWESILSAITPIVGNILSALTGSKYPGASVTGTLASTTAEANLAETKSMNKRQNVNAKTAEEIAVEHHIPKSYDACRISKSSGSRATLGASTMGVGRALSMTDTLNQDGAKGDNEKYAKTIAKNCGGKDSATYQANKAMGCTDGGRGNVAAVPSSLMQASFKVPDDIGIGKVGENKDPGDWGEQYREGEEARRFARSLAPAVDPDLAESAKATPGTLDFAVRRQQTAAFAGSAQAIANAIFAMAAKGGPLKQKQIDWQKEMVAANKMDSVDSEGVSGWDALKKTGGYFSSNSYVLNRLTTLPPRYAVAADSKQNKNMIKVEKARSLAYTALTKAIQVKALYEARNNGQYSDRKRVVQNAPQPAPNAVSDTGHFKVSSTKQESLE